MPGGRSTYPRGVRIIAGEYRRRLLNSPPGMTTRPIPDRVKESVFGLLGLRVQGASFLDCFAGSGAIGLEALSRGAASCMFVEKDRFSGATLEKNIDLLGETCRERCTVVHGDALGLSVLARCPRPLDLAFFDPPYPLIQTRLGWERVKRQCAAVAELLAVKGEGSAGGAPGFLILRTPLPHFVVEEVEGAGAATDERHKSRKFKKHDKPRGGKWDPRRAVDEGARGARGAKGGKGLIIGGERVEPLSEEELMDLGGAGVGGERTDGPQVVKTIADWTIPGTRGPETHEYGTTAVHFYMKA